nr:uncharacterized protein LOC116773412 [Danaus plexippus plexippus]
MDILRHFEKFPWCRPDWSYPSMSKETNELLRQCVDLPQVELSDDIEEIIKKSKSFPIPFPINTVRLVELKKRKSLDKLKRNIVSTYPLIHERVLLLMTHFLIYKRLVKFGHYLFPNHYIELICFNSSEGWESVGTLQQKPPLLLENCLSYDEMKLSAMLYVSGFTYCINDGKRKNSGVVDEDGVEEEAVIIGLIGPRFQRRCRMDNEDILITEEQNCIENGYGEEVTPTASNSAKYMWRKMWSEFYQVSNSFVHSFIHPFIHYTQCLIGARFERPRKMDFEDVLITKDQNTVENGFGQPNNNTDSWISRWRQMWSEFYDIPSLLYKDLPDIKTDEKKYLTKYVRIDDNTVFSNEVYYKRISVLADTTLLEAEFRANETGKDAFINVIGCGLGVWRISSHQSDVYILTFIQRIEDFLKKGLIDHVSDINFSYIRVSDDVRGIFQQSSSGNIMLRVICYLSKIIIICPIKGGVNIQLENREPSSKLSGEHAGKLLVMTYPWDGNAHPGNEFWFGSLKTSGDPAAACSTQVSELHNAHINTTLRGDTVRVAAEGGVRPLREYCLTHTKQ